MASTSIVYPKPVARLINFKPATVTGLVTIEVDCTVSETHSGEMEVTDHPIEKGANVTDHVRRKPETLNIEGIISDTPISKAVRDSLDSMEKGKVTRSKDAFFALRALRDAGQPVTVVTPLKTYTDMVMTSLMFPRASDTGEAIRFSAQFKEIKTVDSQRVLVKLTAKPSGKKKAVDGNKQVDDAKIPSSKRSTLDSLVFGDSTPAAVRPNQ